MHPVVDSSFMRRRTSALVGAVVIAVAFFVAAPIVYSPTTVYGPILLKTYPTYPNWESLSCWTFGFGSLYGRSDVFQSNSAYQFGCPPPAQSLP